MKFLTFDETRDFPYYKHNPRMSKTGWAVLLVLVPIVFIVYFLISNFSELAGGVVFCFGLLIPLLYFSNWDYRLLFHKPTKNEIILAVLMFIGYMVYSIAMQYVLQTVGITSNSPIESSDINYISIIALIFSMMGEELIKFIPLMFFMRVIYKFTNKRTLAFVLSSIIICTYFGMLHYYDSMIMALVLQGLGTVFELYGYYKTKNLLVPYMSHLLTDAFIYILMMMGMA